MLTVILLGTPVSILDGSPVSILDAVSALVRLVIG